MLHSSLLPCLLLLSLPPLESSHQYRQSRTYQVAVPEAQAYRYHQAEDEAQVHRYHKAEDCPPKLTKSCTTSTVPSHERIKTVECHPGPPKKVCKKQLQPDPGCLEVPQPPDQECLDRVEEICQDMAGELCKVDPIETCKTEVRLLCDIQVERKCRFIEGNSPEGIEKCAELQAQGVDCQPSVDPVASDGDDGDVASVEISSDGDEAPVEIGDEAPVEIWETCEEIPLTRSSCSGEVCSDVPVTGSQCDGLDLENCKKVAVNELKCRQVSSIECQALWDRGGDCHYAGVEGDKHVSSRGNREEKVDKPVSEGDKMEAGGMQAFEICEDFPEGEVCREVELEVCHTSDDAVDKPCLEVEVNKCRTDMVDECTVEPICKPLPALPVVETCEEVPGKEICEDVWITAETTKRERTCEHKILCCGEPCPVDERPKKTKPWQKRHGGVHSSRYSKTS